MNGTKVFNYETSQNTINKHTNKKIHFIVIPERSVRCYFLKKTVTNLLSEHVQTL